MLEPVEVIATPVANDEGHICHISRHTLEIGTVALLKNDLAAIL